MTSPSAAHEWRVELLATVAMLSGCRRRVTLDKGMSPDVAAADDTGRRLFVADAKATETAGCSATSRRLRRYLRAISSWRAFGYDARFALCAERGSGDWDDVLASEARSVWAGDVRARSTPVGSDSVLAWLDLPSRSGASPTPRLGTAPDGLFDTDRGRDRVLVLPHPQDEPAERAELLVGLGVPSPVTVDLLAPPQRVGLGGA